MDICTLLLQKMALGEKKHAKYDKSNWDAYTIECSSPKIHLCIINGRKGRGRSKVTKSEVKKTFQPVNHLIVVCTGPPCFVYVKTNKEEWIGNVDTENEADRISQLIRDNSPFDQKSEYGVGIKLRQLIRDLKSALTDFDNRGLFSSYYLLERYKHVIAKKYSSTSDRLASVKQGDGALHEMLNILGYDKTSIGIHKINDNLTLVLSIQKDLSRLGSKSKKVPSVAAVACLQDTPWVILTNGSEWRLYSRQVSSTTTNFFKVTVSEGNKGRALFLAGVFQHLLYAGKRPKIEDLLVENKQSAQKLGENLSETILMPNGIMMNLVKSVLQYNKNKPYAHKDLDDAKARALKILYRIWFVLYAESRNLLPVEDEKYGRVSMRGMYTELPNYDAMPNDNDCWKRLKDLFECIRNGNPDMNLPRYDGGLFEKDDNLDKIDIKNKYITRAIRGLLEQNSEKIDYSGLSVRHLGSVYEGLLDVTIRQADKNILLYEKNGKITTIKSNARTTYSYKKGDLYILGKGGTLTRKEGGAFYTPDEIVSFLVRRGLQPIFDERDHLLAGDIAEVIQTGGNAARTRAMDRLLDIQVLDPAMGSGHFLVEALNQITQWANQMLEKYERHPLWDELAADRREIIKYQKSNNITIDENLLTYDILLKRKIMKRCIFGVDINPLAVELAKLSLWLDSFAIGVPLTYIDHHIKQGDSTIGSRLNELDGCKQTSIMEFDLGHADRSIKEISRLPDITMEQVNKSKTGHHEFIQSVSKKNWLLHGLSAIKMRPDIMPKKSLDKVRWIESVYAGSNPEAEKQISELARRYSFFNWEIEMMDAFTDGRTGFDLIVGNPPWEKNKPESLDFFSTYDPSYRALPDANERKKLETQLLKNITIKKKYDEYLKTISEKGKFYKSYEKQGKGDTDLWQLVTEQTMNLVSKCGLVSVLVPQQILANTGGIVMRKYMLERKIIQLYVFENAYMENGIVKSIFPIHKEYRFLLLTWQNKKVPPNTTIETGFWLHRPKCLVDSSLEKEKFSKITYNQIKKISPDDYIIPEAVGDELRLIIRLSKPPRFTDILPTGWSLSLTSEFHKSIDRKIIKKTKNGFPALEGKTIYQFVHDMVPVKFRIPKAAGYRRLGKVRAFSGSVPEYMGMYRAGFAEVTGPKNIRTLIGIIIPPENFHLYSIYSCIPKKNGVVPDIHEANLMGCYIAGVINSMTFDFLIKAKTSLHVGAIIGRIPVPKPETKAIGRIARLAGRLSCGTDEMAGLGESLGFDADGLGLEDRIRTNARLDVLVARAYGLSRANYETVAGSFKFGNAGTTPADEGMDWTDKTGFRKRYWFDVRRSALEMFGEGP